MSAGNIPVTEADAQRFSKRTASQEAIDSAVKQMTQGDTYEVYGDKGGKKQVANAAAINAAFVNITKTGEPVGITIVDVGKNEKQAWAHVRAYIGQESAPLNKAECKVVIDFELARQKFLWDAIERGVWLQEVDPNDGQTRRVKRRVDYEIRNDAPIPTDQRIQVHLIRLFLQKKIFAERDAESHARERAQRQLLAREWRDEEEQESEQEEMQGVQDLRENEGSDVSLDDTIPFGSLTGKTWRMAAATPEGEKELVKIMQTAKVQKYKAAAQRALALADEYRKRAGAQQPPPTAPPQTPPATEQPRRRRGRSAADDAAPATAPPATPAPPSMATNTAQSVNATQGVESRPTASSSGSAPPSSAPAVSPSSGSETTAAPASPASVASSSSAPAPSPTTQREMPAAVEDAVAVAKLMQSIIVLVAKWPGVEVDRQISTYEEALGAARNTDRVPLAKATTVELEKLVAHLNNIDRIWRLAVSKFGNETAALSAVNDKAKTIGYTAYFDPWLKRSKAEEIETFISQAPIPAASASS